MATMSRFAAKSAGAIGGMLGGLIASAIFGRLWKLVSGKDHPPNATSLEYGWGEVLFAAALQGAVFGMVRTAIDRAGAAAYQKSTGEWVDD